MRANTTITDGPRRRARSGTRRFPSYGALLAEVRARLARLRLDDAGYGVDPLGLSIDGLRRGITMLAPLYHWYFRVRSYGGEHIPPSGPVIMAANHSGMLPIDAAMLCMDAFLQTEPPRVVRTIGDYFVPQLPVIGTFFTRAGMITGSRGNFRHALERDSLMLVFPEGSPGIGKPFTRRYQLARWRVGHAELAIRHRAPVVPVAVIGAEEGWPVLAQLGVRPFGAPYLPIPMTPMPLPTTYHFHYSAPIDLAAQFRPEDADDPDAVEEAATRVRVAVEALIAEGLAARTGVFS